MASQKLVLGLFTAVLIAIFATMSLASPAVHAEDSPTAAATVGLSDDDTTSLIQLSGTVASITPKNGSVSLVTLDDGTQLLVNPATAGAENLVVGQTVTIVASLDDDGEQLVAKSVTPGSATQEPTEVASATDEATDTATPEATELASETPEATGAPTGTPVASCGGNNAQPVATRLAAAFGVSYDEIMAYHCQGIGFGNIAKAYLLAEKTGKNAADFFALRQSGEGWGQIMKATGIRPNELSLGQALKGNKGKGGKSSGPTPASQGNGKGKGKGKGK